MDGEKETVQETEVDPVVEMQKRVMELNQDASPLKALEVKDDEPK